MKGAIKWFAENHVAANLLMLFFLITGVVVGINQKIEVFPESALDLISIRVVYPGASPSEVEEAVVRRIEEKVAALAGVDRVDSNAREGVATVTLSVIKDWPVKELLDEVKGEVDRLNDLPAEAEEPTVRVVTRRSQVINVAVYGDVPETSLKNIAQRIEDEITALPGVSLAESFGVRTPIIAIEISENNLRRYGLTLGQVSQLVRAASLDLPAGSVKTSGGDILVRTKGRRYLAEEYRDVAVITRPDGSRITLGRIGDVREGFEDIEVSARFQGKPAIGLQIFRVADQSALDIAAKVKEYIEKTRPNLPAGVGIDYYQDMSEVLKSRISLLLRNMAFGLALVAVLLTLVMDLRLAFWVTLGIPVSFAFGMMILPHYDVSINMVSLFAFITVLGIVVDDAIIIGENVFRLQEEGKGRLEAAIEGAVEVGTPVIFSVLTTVVAFWPLLLAGGMMGNVIQNLPIVIIAVLLGSLTEALVILPSHLAGSRHANEAAGPGPRKAGWFGRQVKKVVAGPYTRLVVFCVRWRYATAAFGLMILLLSVGAYTSGWLQFTFFPKVEGDVLACLVTMPSGSTTDKTTEVVARLEQSAKDALEEIDRTRPQDAPPLFVHSISVLGLQFKSGHGGGFEVGNHLAQVWIQVLEGEKRNMSAESLIRAWRKKAGTFPDAESILFESQIFSAGSPVEIHLSHPDDDLLMAAANDLEKEISGYPGAYDVADSFLPGKEELQLDLKPVARGLGVTLSDLAVQVRNALYGAEALRIPRERDEVKVLVRYPESERKSLGDVEDMSIRTPDGRETPFRRVAEVHMERGYASIQRAQQRRVIKITANVDEAVSNANEVRSALEKKFLPRLQERYPGLDINIEGEGKEQKESLADVFEGGLVALFAIYALLAVPFRSFTQPIIVMFAIPFGITGAILGHLIMGYNLTLISLFGMVGLSGVVVNDSLVLIDQANRSRREGLDAHIAVVQAGQVRFRAIMLTTLTTFAGLTPMLMEKSLQARFLIPMAVSLGFGILFATFITLFLIPAGYMIREDVAGILSPIWRKLLWVFYGNGESPPSGETVSDEERR